jgi:uncharacterized protein YndB with AHSA1/START domain
MGRFTASIFINSSQQKVFDFLSDPAHLPKWDSDFESAEWISGGTPGVGSVYRASGKRLGSQKDGWFEIVQWDRPDRYQYRANDRMFLFECVEVLTTLKPQDNGTVATLECQYEMISRLKFTESIVTRMGKKRVDGNLNTAKQLLEAG